MPQYANQKEVEIDKPNLKDIKVFAYYDREALAKACKVLNGTEFKLLIYLLAQAPRIKWEISPIAIFNEFGIPEASYHRAIKGLKEKGYLDDEAIHMYPKKASSQNDDTTSIKMKAETSQNDNSNKIRNSISNNNFLNASIEKVVKPVEEDEMRSRSQSIFIF